MKIKTVFFEDNLEEYNRFLLTFENKATRRRYKRHLNAIYSYKDEFSSILELEPNDFRDFFNEVDKKRISIEVKRKYKTSILKFLNHILFERLIRGEKTLNYQLMMTNIHFKVSSSKKYSTMVIKPETIIKIIESIDKEYLIYAKLLIYSGMRIGGLINLEIKNIHFKQRYFEVQEKTTSWKAGQNTYFLPEFFIEELENYCLELQKLNKTKIFNHKLDDFRKILHDFDVRLRPHLFRKALSSNFMRNGLQDSDLISLILNQKPKNVNMTRYQDVLDDIFELRNLYDQYFPYYLKKESDTNDI